MLKIINANYSDYNIVQYCRNKRRYFWYHTQFCAIVYIRWYRQIANIINKEFIISIYIYFPSRISIKMYTSTTVSISHSFTIFFIRRILYNIKQTHYNEWTQLTMRPYLRPWCDWLTTVYKAYCTQCTGQLRVMIIEKRFV